MGLTTRNEETQPFAFDSIDQNLLLSMALISSFLQIDTWIECAKAIEGGDWDVADSLLAEIRSPAPKEESISTRKVVN